MDTITSKQLYNLITSGKMDVTLITSRYYAMEGVADPIEKEKIYGRSGESYSCRKIRYH